MFVQLNRKNYIVNDVLTKIKSNEQNKKLIGFEIQGRNIARSHNTILDASDNVIGEVTSGSFSPTLNKSIGLAYVKKGFTDPDSEVKINIRSKSLRANESSINANYRGAGLSEMAYCIENKKKHRCNGELSLHVLDIIQSTMKASKTGRKQRLTTTCKIPKRFTEKEVGKILN